jgi:large subunit ribosomal protein L19
MKAQGYTKETILGLGVFERNFPQFQSGDTVAVTISFIDIDKKDKKEVKITRTQIFEGLVIAIKNSGIAKTFTVRKIVDGIAVERIFPYYSPNVVSVELKEAGHVRRARIYYMRDRFGKSSLVKRKKRATKIVPGNVAQGEKSVVLKAAPLNSALLDASASSHHASASI